VKRAVQLFVFEDGPPSRPLVERTWRTRSVPEQAFISVAAPHWEIVVTRRAGGAEVTLRGPETRATHVAIPQDAEFFGIEFALGTFLSGVSMGRLVDQAVSLPVTGPTFRLAGSTWEIPGPAGAAAFVDRLADAGVVTHDPVVPAVLGGESTGLSRRSVERRVARATGLTQGLVRQIRRADRAVGLLAEARPPAEAAGEAGYADQAHMARSLRRFVGQRPAEVAADCG
jgi:Helix-turn-helix domain